MLTSFKVPRGRMVRGEKLPEVSLTFKANNNTCKGPSGSGGGPQGSDIGTPYQTPARGRRTTPEAGSGHGLPYGIGRGNVLESSDEFGPLEKTGAQTHKNRQDPAESEGSEA